MSVQEDIETALVAMVEDSIYEMTCTQGLLTQPQAEGNRRRAGVEFVSGTSERLDFGQDDWTESYAIELTWSKVGVDRSQRLDEAAAFLAALSTDQYLGGSITGLTDAYATETLWSDGLETGMAVCDVTVEVRRVD